MLSQRSEHRLVDQHRARRLAVATRTDGGIGEPARVGGIVGEPEAGDRDGQLADDDLVAHPNAEPVGGGGLHRALVGRRRPVAVGQPCRIGQTGVGEALEAHLLTVDLRGGGHREHGTVHGRRETAQGGVDRLAHRGILLARVLAVVGAGKPGLDAGGRAGRARPVDEAAGSGVEHGTGCAAEEGEETGHEHDDAREREQLADPGERTTTAECRSCHDASTDERRSAILASVEDGTGLVPWARSLPP